MIETSFLKLKIPELSDATDNPYYFKEGFGAIDAYLKTKGDSTYTKTEVDNALSLKASTTHSHPYLALTGGALTGEVVAGGSQDLATKQMRNITISAANPSGGSNGDIWLKYS